MAKKKTVLVIDTGCTNLTELLAGGRALGEKTVLFTAERENTSLCADEIIVLDTEGEKTVFDMIAALKDYLAENKPELCLLGADKDARLLAAHAAAVLNTSVFTDVSSVEADGDKIVAKRVVYGGAAVKTESTDAHAIICAGSGVFQKDEAEGNAVVTELKGAKHEGIELVEKTPSEAQTVDLGSAKLVVGIGRGVKSEESLEKAKALAAAMKAELACTRPISEEAKWLPRERYLGVSGANIKPALYIALGISGQIQHMAGVNNAGVILAVNKDKDAAIFKQCDFGIVGDVDQVMPLLSAYYENL